MLQVINYSEKAIAVIGDTKEAKEQLKALGGRFNMRLSCGPGWVFSKAVEDKVRAFCGGAPADASVYVGTYRKYNNGSLEGAWLKLADYANKDEFLKACMELHKDESDPELMFQDWENVPEWMISESSIDAKLWGYVEPEEAERKQTREEIAELLAKHKVHYPSAKDVNEALEIGGKLFVFTKPQIETRFCHPDEPEEDARAWREICTTEKYFRAQNLAGYDKAERGLSRARYICQDTHGGNWNWADNDEYSFLQYEEMTEELRSQLSAALGRARKAFEKRLSAWWKRYGAEKLHCWTYWADR